jgi:hypothetical protein
VYVYPTLRPASVFPMHNLILPIASDSYHLFPVRVIAIHQPEAIRGMTAIFLLVRIAHLNQ